MFVHTCPEPRDRDAARPPSHAGITTSDAWGKLAGARGMGKDELVSSIAGRLAPMGSMEPRQLGDAVAFLCSPQGRLITGVSLPVDGGVHLKT